MAYDSVDQIQGMLTREVFHYAKDSKKAAGRALGTLVEIVTFYLLKAWGLGASVAIERGLSEYGNPSITHNVEYSLHPVKHLCHIRLAGITLPVTVAKIRKQIEKTMPLPRDTALKNQVLVTKDGVMRNACVIGQGTDIVLLGLLHAEGEECWHLDIVAQDPRPYAMFECKRVGVEEGNKKGPQTIEKAKQGAYVARAVSALQRIRTFSGQLHGVVPRKDGSLYAKPYEELLAEIINSSDPALLGSFVLTVGVVSNHGNWFTSDNPNKELLVLAQSYDWLLFLSDSGLSQFITEVLIKPTSALAPAREAFLRSYGPAKKSNEFTKVRMGVQADIALQHYFNSNLKDIELWFNIIAPKASRMARLKEQIETLSKKDWMRILAR